MAAETERVYRAVLGTYGDPGDEEVFRELLRDLRLLADEYGHTLDPSVVARERIDVERARIEADHLDDGRFVLDVQNGPGMAHLAGTAAELCAFAYRVMWVADEVAGVRMRPDWSSPEG